MLAAMMLNILSLIIKNLIHPMKLKALLATLALSASIAAGTAFADTVKFSDGYGTTNGGEFLADSVGEVWAGTFVTFCLERNETVAFNTPYEYYISTSADAGGLSGGNPDPLSQGAAYLYSLLRTNNLADNTGGLGTSYFNLATRHANADAFQKAIWALEGEISAPAPLANYYYDLALANGGIADAWDLMGARVMNIFKTDTRTGEITKYQSQLYYVPDAGMTAVLLGLGFLSLAFLRRKL
jgi:hypothetical protein